MKNKNKLNEAIVDVDDYKKIRTKLTKDELSDLVVTDIDDSIFETDGMIEPQDQATIKYLSNVKDVNTGKVSQPFTIADKNYQMVRGVYPDGNVDMAVYCLDDMDDLGNNIIYSIDEFEQKIALPMKERLEMENTKTESKDETYEGYKHFFVNKKTNEVKKFKTIEEMLSCGKMKEEEYMSTPRFKKYMTEKLFGKRNRLNELGMDQADLQPTQNSNNQGAGLADDEDKLTGSAKIFVKKLDEFDVIKNLINKVSQGSDKGKAIVLATFAERIGVPENKISTIISSIKNIAKTQTPVTEGLKEKKNVIKTIKVKDINNG